MDRFKVFSLPISLLVWIVSTLYFIQYYQDVCSEFKRLHQDVVINYAVDAAVDEMVNESEDLLLDYGDYEYLSCNPEVALETFMRVYLDSYKLVDSKINREWVAATYCKAFLVATYDGFYVGTPATIDENGASNIVFSLKKPYMYIEGAAQYALNMSRQKCKKLEDGVLSVVERPVSLNEDDVRYIINAQVSDALTVAVGEQMGWHNTETIYLPAAMSKAVRTNPIEDTTVWVYMSDLPAGFGRTVDSFAIGGSRVKHEKFVGCYIKNGIKMYQYMDKIDSSYQIIETFETALQAAQAGYEYDISLK